MSFEPTEPQNGVDPNPFTLIDPDTIPYPLTDVWSLNYAAQTLRTGGEDLFGGAEDMSSTWHGVQAHYSAPESETLFAAMDPVLTRGEGIQSDLATVADALEDLAEAAATARRSLNTLRIDAQSLWNANHDKKVWWLNKDEETDEWALGENIRIKDAVNTAWSTFNEAENACASRISATFGGPAYVSPDQAGGDGALVYGLPTDAGERDVSLEHHLSFEGVNSNINDATAWAGSEFHPSLMDWGNPTGQAAWDTVITDVLWGSAVGLTSKLGLWHPDNGWRFDPRGRWDNATAAWRDAGMDAAALVGVHDEHGWLWEPGEGGREGWSAGWDRWTGNARDSIDEVWEGHTAWSTREDGVAYSNTTMAANALMLTGGLPLKALKIIAGAGVVGSMDTPTGAGDAEFDGSGPGSGTGSGSGSDGFSSRGGPGTRGWPSSPLPGAGEGQRPTGERFENPLTHLNESLLDPDRYRPPASTPATPVPDGGGDRPSQSPPAPQPQDSGTPQNRPGDEDAQDAPGAPGERPGVPAPTPRPDGEGDRGDSGAPRAEDDPERRPPRRDEDDESDRSDAGQGTGGPREEPEAERPEPAAGGGGGDEPPNDRTGTGGDDSSGDEPNHDRDHGNTGNDDGDRDRGNTATRPDSDSEPGVSESAPADSTSPGEGSPQDYNDGPPQDISEERFLEGAALIRETVGHISDDIVVQGSRAGGTARPDSDIDIAIRVDANSFEGIVADRFGSPNSGSAKERTMLHAIETGKIQAGEAGLRPLRRRLEKIFGMDVDISIVMRQGPFDRPPFIEVP
nr:nucleotidyltransferase domain-containing protein [Nocardiopsis sp. RV163]